MAEDKTYRILIVDDDENIRGMYAEVFRREGFEVYEAADGLAGLEKAIQEKPDVVFTGIIMPRMDGFALTLELGKNVATSGIPVVMNSHMGRKEDQERAQLIGVKDFIVQGMVTPKSVVERVRSLFELGGGYYLRVAVEELDAPKLAHDLGMPSGLVCGKCGAEMTLYIDANKTESGKLVANFVCSKCGNE